MKLGIIGGPGAGKTTVFEALTRDFTGPGKKNETRFGTIHVPDERIDVLSDMFRPEKTIYAQVEYLLPGKKDGKKEAGADLTWVTSIRDADALILVIRNHSNLGFDAPSPAAEFAAIQQELILTDLAAVEKRLERIEADAKRGKTIDREERELLVRCKEALDFEIPVRRYPELAESRILRGYALLSAKPVLVLFNNADEDESLPAEARTEAFSGETCMVIRGKLEHELAQMSPEEAAELLKEFNIAAPATDRVIRRSYETMGLISFFTVGEDEVRAWTIQKGTSALEAAGKIHTDIRKGFIRAETISYEDQVAAGSTAAAKKAGTFRLEGKTYTVRDGDIINFRFNI